jgi:hypothetical protein
VAEAFGISMTLDTVFHRLDASDVVMTLGMIPHRPKRPSPLIKLKLSHVVDPVLQNMRRYITDFN